MQKTEVREAILHVLENESEPINFERLFEKVKRDFKCSRKTFSDYLAGLVSDDLVIREEITTRNVRYSKNKEGFEKIRKMIDYQKNTEKKINALVEKLRKIETMSGKSRRMLLVNISETLEDLFGYAKLYEFFEVSQVLGTDDLKHLEKMHKKTTVLAKLILSELKKYDKSAYKFTTVKLFFKMLSEMASRQ